jgi:hypothetical protein
MYVFTHISYAYDYVTNTCSTLLSFQCACLSACATPLLPSSSLSRHTQVANPFYIFTYLLLYYSCLPFLIIVYRVSSQCRMVRTKNVTPCHRQGRRWPGPSSPFQARQGQGSLSSAAGGKKKRLLDIDTCATVEAVDQTKQGGQLSIASDQIAFRIRRLSSQARSYPTRFDP